MINFTYSYTPGSPETIDERFKLEYMPITRPLMSWRDEVLAAVDDINVAAGSRPIILCMSGGVDGEIIARAFIERGIPFSALTLNYTFDMQHHIFNLHDTDYASVFCKRYNITQHVHSINWHDFIRHNIPDFISKGYRATMEHPYVQLYMLDLVTKMGGCAVMGSGVQRYASVNGELYTEKTSDYTLTHEWCINNNVIHFPLFFSQNPHIFAAYMQHDIMGLLLSDPKYYQNASVVQAIEKVLIYGQAWPDITRRTKYEGFEQMNLLRLHYNANLRTKFPDIVIRRFPISNIKAQLHIS